MPGWGSVTQMHTEAKYPELKIEPSYFNGNVINKRKLAECEPP